MPKPKLTPVSPATPPETKHQRFRRVFGRRANSAVTAIRRLGNATASGYEAPQEELAKIVAALRSEIDHIEHKFRDKMVTDKPPFEFD